MGAARSEALWSSQPSDRPPQYLPAPLSSSPFLLLAHPLFSPDLGPSSDVFAGLIPILITAESFKYKDQRDASQHHERKTSYSCPSRASSVLFSRAVEDTNVSICLRRETSSRWSRVEAERREPSPRLRTPFGPGAAWQGGPGSGTWGLLRRRNLQPLSI